jgi:hypothetical protein
VPAFFTDHEYAVLVEVCERLLPADEAAGAPGAQRAHVADYIDGLLGAFTFDPPRIWAGGPFSGRHGGEAGFDRFVPLTALDELAWRTRIEGSQGRPEREFNGRVVGWQTRYRAGLAALGDDFASCAGTEKDDRLDADLEFKRLVFEHSCEGMYGDPVYGGNHDRLGWRFIGYTGDSQPAGYTAVEVTDPRGDDGQ